MYRRRSQQQLCSLCTMVRAGLCTVLCLCVCAGAELLIYVNWQVAPLAEVRSGVESTARRRGEYRYAAGDAVHVLCASARAACAPVLRYDYVEERLLGYVNSSDVTIASGGGRGEHSGGAGVGLRTTLRAAHHRTSLHCACERQPREGAIITFVLRASFDDVMNVKMNGVSLRWADASQNYLVRYFKGERFVFKCELAGDVELLASQLPGGTRPVLSSESEIEVIPSNTDVYRLSYVVRNKTTSTPLRYLHINFKQLSFDVFDPTPLLMNVSESNIIMQLYEWRGQQRVYYEYEDGGVVTLMCYTTADTATIRGYRLEFGDAVAEYSNKIIKSIRMSAADDKVALSCSLRSSNENNVTITLKHIQLLFRLKPPATTDTSPRQARALAAGGAAVALCLALAAAAVVACHANKRKRCAQSEPQYTAPVNPTNGGVIVQQNHPGHESHASSSGGTRGAVLARTACDLHYADLDISPSDIRHPNPTSELSPYAEVCFLATRFRPDANH